MQKNKLTVLLSILILIIVVETVVLFTRPTVSIIEPFDDSNLRKEISILDSTSALWESRALFWSNTADSILLVNDSLENRKPLIKIKYLERYNFNSNATTAQLDSVIRSNW